MAKKVKPSENFKDLIEKIFAYKSEERITIE